MVRNGAGLVRSDERRDLRGARHLEREQHIPCLDEAKVAFFHDRTNRKCNVGVAEDLFEMGRAHDGVVAGEDAKHGRCASREHGNYTERYPIS